jgi:hypothetical protein
VRWQWKTVAARAQRESGGECERGGGAVVARGPQRFIQGPGEGREGSNKW